MRLGSAIRSYNEDAITMVYRLTHSSNILQTHIDVAASGALMGKSAEEAQQLIEEMAANKYWLTNEWGNTRRPAGMFAIDSLTSLNAKIDNVVKMLNRQVGSSSASNLNLVVMCCTLCGGDHDESICTSIE